MLFCLCCFLFVKGKFFVCWCLFLCLLNVSWEFCFDIVGKLVGEFFVKCYFWYIFYWFLFWWVVLMFVILYYLVVGSFLFRRCCCLWFLFCGFCFGLYFWIFDSCCWGSWWWWLCCEEEDSDEKYCGYEGVVEGEYDVEIVKFSIVLNEKC